MGATRFDVCGISWIELMSRTSHHVGQVLVVGVSGEEQTSAATITAMVGTAKLLLGMKGVPSSQPGIDPVRWTQSWS